MSVILSTLVGGRWCWLTRMHHTSQDQHLGGGSASKWGSASGGCASKGDVHPGGWETPPPTKKTGGMHPTAMLSCHFCFRGMRGVTPAVLNKNMAAKQIDSVIVILCLCLNLCSSIIIVLINKWIYTYYGFPNMTMTCIHFIFTTVGLILCQQLNTFQPKRLPIDKMLPLSLTFCITIDVQTV